MNNTTFRTILILWLFLSGLVSLSDPTDLINQTVPAVFEYAAVGAVGETKFKVFSMNAPINIFVLRAPADETLRHSLSRIAPQSSSPDRYQLLSTYRI
jgi:hypothetical protein